MKTSLMDAPGAWYGNEIDEQGRGNLVVDVKRIAPACAWLRHHRLHVVETEAVVDFPNPDAVGVLLTVIKK